jgi:competence protein ComEC
MLVDRFTVWRQGAAAVWLEPGGARMLTDRQYRGARPWVPPDPRRRQARGETGEGGSDQRQDPPLSVAVPKSRGRSPAWNHEISE